MGEVECFRRYSIRFAWVHVFGFVGTFDSRWCGEMGVLKTGDNQHIRFIR